jgi:hypothetical protein
MIYPKGHGYQEACEKSLLLCDIFGRVTLNLKGVSEPLHVGTINMRLDPTPCSVRDPSKNKVHSVVVLGHFFVDCLVHQYVDEICQNLPLDNVP